MMDLRTKRIPYIEAANPDPCPDCGMKLTDFVRTSYGWRALCACRDRRWTWVRGDDYVQAERR